MAGSTCHLSEFLTHTLCILVLFEGAWAEAIIVFQCFAHIVNELFVWIDVDSDWVPYIVSADGKLSPVNTGDISVGDVKVIDGGAANGIQ